MNLGGLGSMNKFIILFALLFTIVITLYDSNIGFVDNSIWKHIDMFATAFTLILVALDIWEKRKDNDSIELQFFIEKLQKAINLDLTIVRKYFTRAEIQGIYGTKLINGITQYNVKYTGQKSFFDAIQDVQKAKSNIFQMRLQDSELCQFADYLLPELTPKEIADIRENILRSYENKKGSKHEHNKKLEITFNDESKKLLGIDE